MSQDHQDIFMKLSEKSRKKGGSLSAVFKLIQELADFEEKIEECSNAQEISQNKEKIEGFIGDLDRMYDALFEMARGGISSIRSSRGGNEDEERGDTEYNSDNSDHLDIDTDLDANIGNAIDNEEKKHRDVSIGMPRDIMQDMQMDKALNIPTIPRM